MNILKKIFSAKREVSDKEDVNQECTSQSSTVSRKDIISQTGNEVVIASQTPYGIDISDEVTPGTLGKTITALRKKIVDMVGPQFFESKMEMFDEELAAAYREVDYLQMKIKCKDAEMEYYKACNDPRGLHGPQLLEMHNRVIEFRETVSEYEMTMDPECLVQPENVQDMFSDIHNNPQDEIESAETDETVKKQKRPSYIEDMENHRRPNIMLDAPLPGTLPSLPINFD